MTVRTATLGFPRIGPRRELKSALERHWAGKIDEAKDALAEARRLNPKLTVKWLIEHTSGMLVVLDGVRKAGLPEE